jgi:large subunit ribosomal protein L21
MYAVIKTGGKQQRVAAGDVIEVERLVDEGDTVTFTPLLVVDDQGTAHVGADLAKAAVVATPLRETKGDKIKVFKYRPKSGYARKAGHRQIRTVLEIAEIKLPARRGAGKVSDETPAAPKPADKKPTAKKPAAKKPAAKKPAAKKPAAKKPTTAAE